ncbi:MAG: SDR family oxidoreductase [Pseudomonadota bacterium]
MATLALSDKTVVITGATSGIGAATARVMAAQGARLLLLGRNAERAKRVQKTVVDEGGVAETFIGDVSESTTAEAAVKQALQSFGHLNALVNAAGVIYRGNAVQTSDQQWRDSMSANVDGSFFMSRAAVSAMKHGGSIVNIASTCGLVGAKDLTAYCVSKGAIVQLTRAMALDHADENIRVNSVCPGAIDTPMLVSGHERSGASAEQVLANNLAEIPQGRIPGPEEVAELIAFLCSDVSSHITGTNIPIDGGYTAQ